MFDSTRRRGGFHLRLRGDGSGRRRACVRPLPLKQNGGTWDSGHVQGIAVDVKGGYIYYSFTNLLAKYDFSGKLIGTVVGWTRSPRRSRFQRGRWQVVWLARVRARTRPSTLP